MQSRSDTFQYSFLNETLPSAPTFIKYRTPFSYKYVLMRCISPSNLTYAHSRNKTTITYVHTQKLELHSLQIIERTRARAEFRKPTLLRRLLTRDTHCTYILTCVYTPSGVATAITRCCSIAVFVSRTCMVMLNIPRRVIYCIYLPNLSKNVTEWVWQDFQRKSRSFYTIFWKDTETKDCRITFFFTLLFFFHRI